MTTWLSDRPDASEYASFYHAYVSAVPKGDIVELLRDGGRELGTALAAVPESRAGFRYGEGKWSIAEVLGHMIDAERIFTYRALRIARGDATPLPGFEQNDYVKTAGSEARTIANLAEELAAVRECSVLLFQSLPADAWSRRGVASGNPISVRALAYITAGHARHHLRVLQEKYLVG
jgi:DinB superfamily